MDWPFTLKEVSGDNKTLITFNGQDRVATSDPLVGFMTIDRMPIDITVETLVTDIFIIRIPPCYGEFTWSKRNLNSYHFCLLIAQIKKMHNSANRHHPQTKAFFVPLTHKRNFCY